MHVLSVHPRFSYVAVTSILFFSVLSFASVAQAATLELSPSSGTPSTGDTFTVTISADPEGDTVHAVESQLVFDATRLEVVGLSKTAALSLWTQQPTFSNTAGTIDFGGARPSPLVGPTDLLIVTFRALEQEGVASVSVADASMRNANDTNTETYSGSNEVTYTITAVQHRDDLGTEEDDGATVRTPFATSSVFSDPEAWYAVTEGVFTWDVPQDVARIALEITESPSVEPNNPYEPPVERFMVTSDLLNEGVQYFALQYKYPEGWGETYHHPIRIDTVPPEPFTLQVYTGNASTTFPMVVFDASDETSGIRHYEILIGDQEPEIITPDQAQGGYMLHDLIDGSYTVRVVAEDMAGNTRSAETLVHVTAGWQPVAPAASVSIPEAEHLILLLLLGVIVGQWLLMLRAHRIQRRKEDRLRKETQEIQDQMEKIFSALREEIHDQINSITKRKRLSAREKEAVASLNQALEISETLIEKEVVDVNKLLR